MGSIDDLYRHADAVALAGYVRADDVTPAEPANAAIRAIQALNPKLNAEIHREQLRQMGCVIVAELLPFDVYLTLSQPPRRAGYYDMSLTDLEADNGPRADAVFMAPFNVWGQPAMSLPLGMPGPWAAGVQVVGGSGDEAMVLQVATVLKQVIPWGDRHPPVRWQGHGDA
jgi:Asp-tRNA(Asn)/Glu-tRNA(Gln) amidotransferase A subunit family amidase